MFKINRRKFVTNTVSSGAGLLLGSRLLGLPHSETINADHDEQKRDLL